MAKLKDIREYLARLPEDEQREAISYLLTNLLGHRLDAKDSLTIYKQDGTLLGHLRPLSPPSVEEKTEMNERGNRVNPAHGRSTADLLEQMRTGDEESVRSFVHRERKRGS
jgi:hypothetical protein